VRYVNITFALEIISSSKNKKKDQNTPGRAVSSKLMQQVHQIQHNYTNEILSLWTHEVSDNMQVMDGKDDNLNETNAHEERDEKGRHSRMREARCCLKYRRASA